METNGNGTHALQARLNDPNTTAALTRLLDRIDSLEATVSRLADVVEQAPGFTAMVGDMVDETYRNASAGGIDLEARLQSALTLAEKLTHPDMVDKLDRFVSAAETAPHFTAMASDIIDETVRNAASDGIYIEERVAAGLGLAEKLTRPGMVDTLNQALEFADTAPGFFAMIGDIADEAYRNAAAQGIDLEKLLSQGATAASKLGLLLESGVLDDDALNVVGAAGKALANASQEKIEPIGLFGLLGALRDPDTQRALGFLTNVGKQLGRELPN